MSYYNKPITFSGVQALYKHISRAELIDDTETSLLLIGGCSRSGKSSIAGGLSYLFSVNGINNLVISLDNWLVSVEKRKIDSRVIDRYNCNSIVDALRSMLKGDTIYPPIYDVHSRQRIAERGNTPLEIKSGVVIAEGVVALALKDLFDLAAIKIYVKIDDDLRQKRLELFYKEKGLNTDKIQRVISEREKEEVPFIKNTIKYANYIIENGQSLLN